MEKHDLAMSVYGFLFGVAFGIGLSIIIGKYLKTSSKKSASTNETTGGGVRQMNIK